MLREGDQNQRGEIGGNHFADSAESCYRLSPFFFQLAACVVTVEQ